MLTPILTQKMDLQFFTYCYREMKTSLAFMLGFSLFAFQLALHISTLFWPCRNTETCVRLKYRHGGPCSMLPLGTLPYSRPTFCLQDLTIMCVPTWGTEQLLSSTTLNTEHRRVQVTDPAARLCRGFGRPVGFSNRSVVLPFKSMRCWQQGNTRIEVLMCLTQQDVMDQQLCPERRKGNSEMNCSAEERLTDHPCRWQEDVKRREGERDQKCQ